MYTTKIRTTWLWTSLWACNLDGLTKPLLQPGSSQRCCFILDILQSVQSSYSKRLIIVGKHCPKHNLSSGNIRAWCPHCPAPPEFSKEKVSKTARTDKNLTFYGAANRKWNCMGLCYKRSYIIRAFSVSAETDTITFKFKGEGKYPVLRHLQAPMGSCFCIFQILHSKSSTVIIHYRSLNITKNWTKQKHRWDVLYAIATD